MRPLFLLPFCQLRCYADSSFRGGCDHVRQYQRIRGRTWSRIRCYPSNHPIPNPERWMLGCVIGDYSHRNTTECCPRCMLSRYCESQPRSWWHRWKRSLDNLQKNCGKFMTRTMLETKFPVEQTGKWRHNSKSVVLKSMIYYCNLLPHCCLFLLNFIYTELYNILYFSANFWRTKTLGSYDFVSIREVLYILDVGTFILLSTKR